ncbi:hypothetical protein [Bradyrhizobium sp. WSM471]|uniref:hypothetical protein n=1 Tax=Bradyrhizobium sp. WSM471 TaxID=319017 RepID=UPI00024D1E4E|nr:hypothetical protein Bra471DRAFT_01795 [Bradyrhizobium sp. WSM471]
MALAVGKVDVITHVNFQVTVLKILASYPDGFASMVDLKRDMAILATSGRDWAERTKRLAARVPNLDIFSQRLIERVNGGWRITDAGRVTLKFMEVRPSPAQAMPETELAVPEQLTSMAAQPPAVESVRRRHERQQQRRTAKRDSLLAVLRASSSEVVLQKLVVRSAASGNPQWDVHAPRVGNASLCTFDRTPPICRRHFEILQKDAVGQGLGARHRRVALNIWLHGC